MLLAPGDGMDANAVKSLVDKLRRRAADGPPFSDALNAVLAALPKDVDGEAEGTWEALTAQQQDDLVRRLCALDDTRCCEGALMSPDCAPTPWIVLLVVYAMLGLVAILANLQGTWSDAVDGGENPAQRRAVAQIAEDEAKQAAQETASARKALADLEACGGGEPADVKACEETRAKKKHALDVALESERQAWERSNEAAAKLGPSPARVLRTVILLGALGAFVHLITSLTIYIGNREFLRSWIVYYLLGPLQGAALAPIMYLLITATVLGVPTQQNATQNQNLLGVYAFSALTGLFAKQAIEKMKDVFSTLFTKITEKDPVNSAKK